MAKDEIRENLKDVICDYVEIDRNELTDSLSLVSDMGIDSFSLISMINSIEDKFGISIPEYELVNFNTMSDVVNYISANI